MTTSKSRERREQIRAGLWICEGSSGLKRNKKKPSGRCSFDGGEGTGGSGSKGAIDRKESSHAGGITRETSSNTPQAWPWTLAPGCFPLRKDRRR